MELTELYKKVIEYGDICDHCLGRLVAKRSFGLSNDMRGKAIRIAAALELNEPYKPQEDTCWICGNFFENTEEWALKVKEAVKEIECKTFVMGTKVPPLMAESEEMIWSDLSLADPEPLKSETNREVGKAVSQVTDLVMDLKNPDVVAVMDIAEGTVEIAIRPIFFYARYLKYERGIPQTHWACRSCRGAGCEKCNGTGKQYADSVEELIGRPLLELFKASGFTLHGAGREDIDAVMTGSGRPFVMEISDPLIRSVDLKTIEETVNKAAAGRVAITTPRFSKRSEVETLKSYKGHKKYRILVDIDDTVPENNLISALKQLSGVKIQQRTPIRVAHRRADKIRERMVTEIAFVGMEGALYAIEVTGEAGLYIKELISGDSGRTTPSLSEILGIPARVSTLDVVFVEGMETGDEKNGTS